MLSASQRQISEMSLVNNQNLEDNNLPSNICCRIYDCDLDINPSTLSEWEYYHAHTPHVLVSTTLKRPFTTKMGVDSKDSIRIPKHMTLMAL